MPYTNNTNISCGLVALIIAGALVTIQPANAGGTHGKSQTGHAEKTAKDADRTIKIKMHDNLYDPETISVKKGETIRFVVQNDGEFVHEFNIGTAETHAGHQKEMMMMMEHGVLLPDRINRSMMKMDMGNGVTMEHNDPNSVLLEPGEVGEVIWTFDETADLEFACNVPGHYESGMVGKVTISPKPAS
ncbi:copper-binding protein [Alphaproteobacteria bacterium HT1-32]|nr:copper-binding protein [Alphaproteobacteria bacterium HT1-32]